MTPQEFFDLRKPFLNGLIDALTNGMLPPQTYIAARGVQAIYLLATDNGISFEKDFSDFKGVYKKLKERFPQDLENQIDTAYRRIGQEVLSDPVPAAGQILKSAALGLGGEGRPAIDPAINNAALKLQAALRFFDYIDNGVKPTHPPRVFPDTPKDVADIQNAFLSCMKIDFADLSAGDKRFGQDIAEAALLSSVHGLKIIGFDHTADAEAFLASRAEPGPPGSPHNGPTDPKPTGAGG